MIGARTCKSDKSWAIFIKSTEYIYLNLEGDIIIKLDITFFTLSTLKYVV